MMIFVLGMVVGAAGCWLVEHKFLPKFLKTGGVS
jgi:hypothetical protein